MTLRLSRGWPATTGGLLAVVLFSSSAIDQTLPHLAPRIFDAPAPIGGLALLPDSVKAVWADGLYIRAILAIGDEDPRALASVHRNLHAAVALDPGLISAYLMGGVVAPRGKAGIPKGIRFLKECAARAPQEWRIPFWMGFDYLQLGNDLKAAEAYRRASSLPGAPHYVRGITAWEYYKAGKPDLALRYLQGVSQALQDPALRKALERKITWLSRLVLLEDAVRALYERDGRWPMDLQELVSAGLLDEIPEDPVGEGYYLDEAWYKHPGRVRSREHRGIEPPAPRAR